MTDFEFTSHDISPSRSLNEQPPDASVHWQMVQDPSNDSQDRIDALYELVQHYSPDYLPGLIQLLKDASEEADVRGAVAIALGKLGHYDEREDNPYLAALLAAVHDDDNRVKNYAIQGLGIMGRKEAIPALIDLLREPDNTIFSSVADALGRLGRPAVPYLVELLKQGAPDAQCVAAWKLGELGYEEAVAPLVAHTKTTENEEVIALCVWALGEIGHHSAEVMDVLNWAKEHPAPDVYVRSWSAIKKVARHMN